MKCPKCGQLADPFATKCPNCGPIDEQKSGKKPAPMKPMKVPKPVELPDETLAVPDKPAKRSLLPGLAKGAKSEKKGKPVDAGTAASGGTSFLTGLMSKLQPKVKAKQGATPPDANADDDFSIEEPLNT